MVHSEDPDTAIYWLLCEKRPKVTEGVHTEEEGGSSTNGESVDSHYMKKDK